MQLLASNSTIEHLELNDWGEMAIADILEILSEGFAQDGEGNMLQVEGLLPSLHLLEIYCGRSIGIIDMLIARSALRRPKLRVVYNSVSIDGAEVQPEEIEQIISKSKIDYTSETSMVD